MLPCENWWHVVGKPIGRRLGNCVSTNPSFLTFLFLCKRSTIWYEVLIQKCMVSMCLLLLLFFIHWVVVMATGRCLCNLGGLWDPHLKVIQKVTKSVEVLIIIAGSITELVFIISAVPGHFSTGYKSSLLCGIMAIWTMDRNFDTWVRLLWLPRIIIAAEIVTTLLTQQLLVESWKYDHLDPDMHDLRPNRWKTGHVCEKSKLCCDKRCYCNAMGSVMLC